MKSWDYIQLDKLTERDSPITYGVIKPGPEGEVLFIRGGDLEFGRVRVEQLRTITQETSNNYKRTVLKGGELLISLVGTPGQVAIVPTSLAGANIARQVGLIRLSTGIDKRYLCYYLQSPQGLEALGAETSGSVQLVINLGALRTVKVPVPVLEEQKRIVDILDRAFADIEQARAKTEQNLKNARELFESYLQQVFSHRGGGWVESELFEHVKFIDYRGKTPKKTEQGLRLITAKNVRMGYLKVEPQEFVAPESYESWMTRGIPQKGDVLFTTEAPLANVAQLDTDEKTVFAQRIITMQPDQNILNSTFLKYMLMSQPIQQLIHDKGTGATCTGIKASLLKKIPITYPSDMNEQVEYVDVLDSLTDKVKLLESIYIQKLSALDNLKKSILHKAFSGELTETLEVDTNKGVVV